MGGRAARLRQSQRWIWARKRGAEGIRWRVRRKSKVGWKNRAEEGRKEGDEIE